MLVLQSLLFGSLITLIALYATFVWRRRRMYQLAAKIPGPNGLPFIGHGLKFLNGDFKQIFELLVSITEGYSTISKIWLGPELLVFAETPESLQIVLNSQKCLDKSPLYDVLVLTKGLLVGSGELWKRHRKILNPTFSIGILQQLIPTFDEKSQIFVRNLKKEIGREEFDVYGYMSACSLETLLKGTMEIDRDFQSDPLNNSYINHIEVAARICMKKMLNILYQIEPIYRWTKLHTLEQKHVFNGLLKIADEVYDEKLHLQKQMLEDESSVVTQDDDGYKRKPKNFLRTIMDPASGLTEEEIKHEINTLIAAGHETSALVISNTLLMLAIHPEVQQKVVNELKEVFKSADATVDYNSLNKLVYLDMVLRETMRLFPVLPLSARKSTDEFDIGDHTIPAGATIIISAFTVQRNKAYWGDDADLFRPERFEPESFKKVPAYAYIPFTGGPRICIGWRYGMLFMKTVIANFLRQYEASNHLKFEELDYEITLSMKIVQRCMISVREREF